MAVDNQLLQNKSSILNLLGCLYHKPADYMNDSDRPICEDDFVDMFHKKLYVCLKELFSSGINKFTPDVVEAYITQFPKAYELYKANKGSDYLEALSSVGKIHEENFDYHYKIITKYTLLRNIQKNGISISELYDPDNAKVMDKFHNLQPEDMFQFVQAKLFAIEESLTSSKSIVSIQAGAGLRDLISSFEVEPDIGAPLQGELFNRCVRGGRLGKLYLESAPSGLGKTRSAVGNACNISIPLRYDWKKRVWVELSGYCEPTMIITTELPEDEIQTLMVAHVSGVEESKILENETTTEEKEIILKAIDYIEESPIYIERVAEFDIGIIKNRILKAIAQKNIEYVFFDYIHMSLKLLIEIGNKAKGSSMREDQILLMFIAQMKDLAESSGIFFGTSTQVNGDWKLYKGFADQNLLRGSKAMADKADVASIMLPLSTEEEEALEVIVNKLEGFTEIPNVIKHIYKVRRGKYSQVKIWSKFDLGTCRMTDVFMTTAKNELKVVDGLKIVKEKEIVIEPDNVEVLDLSQIADAQGKTDAMSEFIRSTEMDDIF